MLDDLKIAIVCDWLTVYAGAERVIFEIHKLFPKAPIYTSLYNKEKCFLFKDADVRESWLKYVPGARNFHQLFLPFMPRIFEDMDFSEFDLVISSSHSVAKGIITKPNTLHVSYCHSPMRYAWDQSHAYVKNYKTFRPLSLVYKPILHKIRIWDKAAADRVDQFVANSDFVKARIQKYYRRDSKVVFPPVDLSFFSPANEKRDAYIAVGRLIPYKKFDLLVQAANKFGFKLKIVGVGSEINKLKKMAHSNIEFLGKVSDQRLMEEYQKSKALVFPQLEDFGIVPLEAIASGTPVIAFNGGGAKETVSDGVSGIFFDEQSVDSIGEAIKRFEKKKWDENKVANSIEKFSQAHFKAKLLNFLEKAWTEHQEMLA